MISQRLYRKKDPEQCQAPHCKNYGELVILDDTREDCHAAEFECVLCEHHYAEARGAGQ